MQGAYGVASLSFNGTAGTGNGETIAILDPGDDTGMVNSSSSSFSSSDLAIFDRQYGLADPPSFIKEGFTNADSPELTTTLPGAATGDSDEETSLDVEWAHVMAPKANILLVEGSPDFSDIYNGILAVDNAPSSMDICALSMSFDASEIGTLSSTANAEGVDGFYFDNPGLVYLASAGDAGAYDRETSTITPQFPASSSNVLSIGGTTLSVSGNSYAGESTWGHGTNSGMGSSGGGGGGGFSAYEPQPAYQVGKVNGLTTTARSYPDISLEANPNTGVEIYDSPDFGTGTGWIPASQGGIVGGTSLSSPLMAGLIADVDQGRALSGLAPLNSSGGSGIAASNPNGNAAALDAHALLYGLGYSRGDFHDITSGSSIGPTSYGPKSGYDLSTGIGSPVANTLLVDLTKATISAVTSNKTSPTYGQSLTLTATVTTSTGATSETGTVQFQVDGTNFGSPVAVSSGIATLTTSTLGGGTHSIVANYSGDSNFVEDISPTFTQVVTKAATTTAVTSTNLSSSYGQSVTFTATVTPASGSGESGTVQFQIDGANVGNPVTVSNGTAAFTTTSLAVAAHSVVAVYSGDSNFTGSTSSTITQTVSKAATGTSVTSSSPSSTFGQIVIFTATVMLASGTGETGTVQFNIDGSNVGSPITVSNGTAAYATSSLAPGSHSVVAVYSGDTNFTGSTSPAFTQGVTKASTSTTVTSSNASPISGQSVTFTATVTPASGTGVSGTVQFQIDGSNAGSPVTVSVGTAAYTTSSMPPGSHTVIAIYSGDSNFSGSTSSAFNQTVLPQPNVVSITTNDGAGDGNIAQESEVRQLVVTFNEPVTLTQPGAFSLDLLNSGGSGLGDNSSATDVSSVLNAATSSDGGTTWTITFASGVNLGRNATNATTAANATDASGSLNDGIYTLIVNDADVTSGGVALAGSNSYTFHRLYGDIIGTGNGTANGGAGFAEVTAGDIGRFNRAYLQSFGAANYNASFDFAGGNSEISAGDSAQLNARYLKTYTLPTNGN